MFHVTCHTQAVGDRLEDRAARGQAALDVLMHARRAKLNANITCGPRLVGLKTPHAILYIYLEIRSPLIIPNFSRAHLAHGHVGIHGWLRSSRGVRLPRWRVGPRPYRRGALPPRARVRLQPLCQRMEVRLPLLLGPVRRRAATERLAAQHAVPLAAQQLQPAPLLRAALLLPVCATRRAARHRDGRRLVHRPALHLEP